MAQEQHGAGRRSPSEEEAKALASATRIRILRMCLKERLTNKEIATRLEANPATVLHHVRKLVATGFLEPEAARAGASGALEVPYRATRKSRQLDLDAGDLRLRTAMIGAFVSEVGQVPDSAEVEISRLSVRLSKADHDRLLQLIRDFLDEAAGREPAADADDGTQYSIFVAVHPDPVQD